MELISLFTLLGLGLQLGSCTCECGYSIQDPDSKEPIVFLDLLETDFTKINDISTEQDWRRQQFNVSAQAGRGSYGKAFMPENVETRPAETSRKSGGDAGLILGVGSDVRDGAVSVAEIDSARLDLHWGTFRAGMKLTATSGTCAAFFWYFNDTQEIDMEFLSREFNHSAGTYPINLVVQSKLSLEAGYDASKTGTFERVDLGFDPTQGFHEYRFDYTFEKVLFYADSKLLARMGGSVMPSSGGHVILQHWSNGNPKWSGGPPDEDTAITVSYVKAYFNSSTSERQAELSSRCIGAPNAAPICRIPNVTAGNASTGGGYFSKPASVGASPDAEESGGGSARRRPLQLIAIFALMVLVHLGVGLPLFVNPGRSVLRTQTAIPTR